MINTGGAGEGKQMIGPEGNIPNKDEVKSDAVLPSFCEPPNPCPPGMTAEDGCLEEFINNAEFSRQYQANQDCFCDEDHIIDDILQAADIKYQHKGLVAKKFHQKKRVRRSLSERQRVLGSKSAPWHRFNPYLRGKALKVVAKKGHF
ncbi:unnamed protein product [Soboliphyme baturini]|uniref:Neuroendocrine protein 7B2 n=1 Tax=Soboliphyme baturini TaxID=241478 RepID=A0A183J2W7_9BILA|nr:unnamed protein product [Soboliphyme baturini]